MSRLNARSEWLLRYAVGRLPYGFCTTTRLEGSPDGLDMTNVRGLQKRGWMREGENGIFYATEAGKAAVKNLEIRSGWRKG